MNIPLLKNKSLSLNNNYSKPNGKSILKLSTVNLFLSKSVIHAQEVKKEASKNNTTIENEYKPFNIGLHLKNMHLWHGFVVTPAPMLATNLDFNSRDKKLKFGLWGTAGFSPTDVTNKSGDLVSATYKELSVYTFYRFFDKFFIEAISHNNYTYIGVEETGDVLHYWSYDKTQGYNFVDLNFGYQVTKSTSLYLATILA
jgi:hypothetical protein